MKKNSQKKFEANFLSLENMSEVKGGHKGKFCITVELKQCVVEEAKYCGKGGASFTEITGPVNPWGK